jgi:hypothetical protein
VLLREFTGLGTGQELPYRLRGHILPPGDVDGLEPTALPPTPERDGSLAQLSRNLLKLMMGARVTGFATANAGFVIAKGAESNGAALAVGSGWGAFMRHLLPRWPTPCVDETSVPGG